jgi:hypothetical protein
MERITFGDPRAWLAAVIYFAVPYFAFETPVPNALGLAAAVLICWAFGFGRHWIMNVAVAVMLIGFAVMVGWLSAPARWPTEVSNWLNACPR